MKRLMCLLGLLLVASLTAAAQDYPKAEAFFGYSYVRFRPATTGAPAFNLNGGSASLAYNPTRSIGIVGDVGGYTSGNIAGTGIRGTLYTYLFGPRLSYRGSQWLTPYAQVLFGGAHATSSGFGGGGTANSFAMAAGGGVDLKATEHVAIRLAQFDYLMTRLNEGAGRVSQNNFRLSSGILFRF